MTDADGHCPICVVPILVAAAAVYIILSPQTIHAPTPNDTYRERSPSSAAQIVTMGAFDAIGGPIVNKAVSKIGSKFTSRGAGEAAEQVTARGARNPKVAEKLAEGRAKHAEFAAKVKEKLGWRSEPTLKDPKTGNTVKPDAVTPSGKPVELKPNSPSGRARGRRQLPAQERATGKKGRVIYYEPKN